MTAAEPIVWEEWRAKPVVVRMVRFTGFGDRGNGHALLGWLEDRGINSIRDGEDILLVAQERDDARAQPGCWFVIGTRAEVYPIRADVQTDKYERVQ